MGIDPRWAVDRALTIASGFPAGVDLFEIEFLIARLLVPGGMEDSGLRELFGALTVQALESRATPESVGLLRGISGLTAGELSSAAASAADRLETAGIVAPRWCGRLVAPVRAVALTRSTAPQVAVLMGSFERGGDIHGFLVCVDLRDGVAAAIVPMLGDVPGVEGQVAGVGLPGVTQCLSAGEFRREVESVLDRRALRDRADLYGGVVSDAAEEGENPPYALAATLLRARLAAIESAVVISDAVDG
ncbi:hypothetical protein [Nocardia sp. NPDC004722]